MADDIAIKIGAVDTSGAAFDSAGAKASKLEKDLARLATVSGQLNSMAGQVRTAFVALGGAFVVDRLLAWNDEIIRTRAALKDQADAVGLTTDQLQAYQAAARSSGGSVESMQRVLGTFNATLGSAFQGEKTAAQAFIDLGIKILDAKGGLRDTSDVLTETARRLLSIENPAQRAALAAALFGKEGKQLTPVLREIAKGTTDLNAEAKAANQTLDQDTIATLNRLQNQSDQSKVAIGNLWAQFATPIEAKGLSLVSRLMQEIADSVALINTHRGVFDQIMEVVNLMGGGAGGLISGQTAEKRALDQLDQLSQKYFAARDKLTTDKVTLGENSPGYKEEVADVEKLRQEYQAAAQAYQQWYDKRHAKDGGTTDTVTVTGSRFAMPKETGAGKRDRIQENLDQVTKQADAARKALDALRASPTDAPLKEIERQIDTQKKIEDELAKLGKYNPADPRIPQLEKEIALRETLDTALQKQKEDMQRADEVEAKYGDGTKDLNRKQLELNDALATGRLTEEAYTIAVNEAAKAQAQQAAQSKALQGGLTGFAGGLELAALRTKEANDAAHVGAAAWDGMMSALDDGLDALAGRSSKTFEQIAGDFIMMIAKMEARYAVSTLMTGIFGSQGGSGGGGLLGGLLGSLFSGGGGDSIAGGTFADAFAGGLIPMASGGDPAVGVPHLVGERGPELFVPKVAGTIIPNDQLGAGGSPVAVHINISTGVIGQVRGELVNMLPHIQKSVTQGLIDARQRGGKVRAAFR